MMLDIPGLWHSEENYGFFKTELFQKLQIFINGSCTIKFNIWFKFKYKFNQLVHIKLKWDWHVMEVFTGPDLFWRERERERDLLTVRCVLYVHTNTYF